MNTVKETLNFILKAQKSQRLSAPKQGLLPSHKANTSLISSTNMFARGTSKQATLKKPSLNYHTSAPRRDGLGGVGSIIHHPEFVKVALGITATLITGSTLTWLTFKSNNVSQQRKDIQEEVNTLKKGVEANWKEIDKLISALKMDSAIALLQLHPKIDPQEIAALEKLIEQLQELRRHNKHFLQQAEQAKSTVEDLNIIRRSQLTDVKTTIENLIATLNLQDQELKLAISYCETLHARKDKRFEQALIAVNVWINDLNDYKQLLSNSRVSASLNSVDDLLVNGYNLKAKIYRALAGVDLEQLDQTQLKLSKENYEKALAIKENIVVRSSLGFLLNDMSNMEADPVKKAAILQEALNYHTQALKHDSQDPNFNHGLGYDLYKIEKLNQDLNKTIDLANLEKALAAYAITERRNSNARLFHDRGLIYLLKKDEASAEREFNRGIALDPDHVLLRYERGQLLWRKHALREALSDFQAGRMMSVNSSSLVARYDQAIDAIKAELGLDTKQKAPVDRKFADTASQTTSDSVSFDHSNKPTFKEPVSLSNDELDITKVAKQAVFENTLRDCAGYAKQLNLAPKKIKIFISYSWGNPAHEKRVEQFAKELEIAGFEVLLDRWFDRKGKDLMGFVAKLDPNESDYVIVVGTNTYLDKYKKIVELKEGREPVVGVEARLIDYFIGFSRARSERVVPVLLEGPSEKSFPPLLLPKLFVDLWKSNSYLETLSLVRDIYQIPNRDEHFESLKKQFEAIANRIDTETPKELADQYRKAKEMKLAEREQEIDEAARRSIQDASGSSPKP